jgi:hypothetical protein
MSTSLINYPYPATHYCDLPPEDQTNHPLCRPLPNAHFYLPKIPQAIVRPPPPGSAGWVSQKAANGAVPARGAWGRGTPATLHIPNSTRGGKAPASAKTSFSPTKRGKSSGSSPCTYMNISARATCLTSSHCRDWRTCFPHVSKENHQSLYVPSILYTVISYNDDV